MSSRATSVHALCLLLAWVLITLSAQGQTEDNPVYVDDSPRAWQLFQRAADHAPDNPSEAVRLYIELLDQYAYRLLPRSREEPDHFLSVRRRVHEAILADETLRDRFRLIASAEADRMLEARQLRDVIRTRLLTQAGLEATLRLAQHEIEQAHFQSALNLLEPAQVHPDLRDRRLAQYWLLRGYAAHRVNDSELLATALRTLEGIDAPFTPDYTAELERLISVNPGEGPRLGETPLQPGPAVDFEAMLGRPIWVAPLDESAAARLQRDFNTDPSANRSTLSSSIEDGSMLAVLPTSAGNTVYINEGHRIRALDRFSQRELWTRSFGRSGLNVSGRGGPVINDMNVVTVHGDSLVSLTGHAQPSERSGDGAVVCLDVNTGSLRWEVELDELGGRTEFEDLFPHGAPIIADDLVIVLARRPTREHLSSCFLVALDLASGKLRWHQYIASSGGLARQDVRPLSSPAYDAGSVYIATPIGAMARVDASTGEVRWLRRLPLPIMPASRGQFPWQISSPAVLERGMIATSPDRQAVMLLDLQSGDDLVRHPARVLGNPDYFLVNDMHLYAVGRHIYCFRPADLGMNELQPVWVFDHYPNLDADLDIRGRVQLVENGLVVPTIDRVLLIDDVTSAGMAQLAVDDPGNVLALGPQLFAAGNSELHSFMAIDVAERMLRERATAENAGVEPALSLLRLSIRAVNLELALEATGMVLKAMEGMEEGDQRRRAHRELFSLLLEVNDAIAAETIPARRDMGDALHERLDSIVSTPGERVRQLLARGDWLLQSAERDELARIRDAGSAYQRLLDEPILRKTVYVEEEIARPAEHVACERLRRLIADHGEEAYEDHAVAAALAFDEASRHPVADDLAGIAVKYPFADAGIDAAVLAASLMDESGRPREAIGLLADTARATGEGRLTDRVIGTLAHIAADNAWHRTARAWLHRAAREWSIDDVQTPAGTRGVREWIATLDDRFDDSEPVQPKLGPIDLDAGVEYLAGRLVEPATASTAMPVDHFLIQEGMFIRVHNASDLSMRLETEVNTVRARLLRSDEERLILWMERDRRNEVESSILAFDSQSGERAWTLEEITTRLALLRENGVDPDEFDDDRRRGNGRRTGDAYDVFRLQLDDRLFMIGHLAGAMAIDLAEGPAPAWAGDHTLSRVDEVAVHELAIALAGISVVDDDETRRRRRARTEVVLLDPRTGDLLGRFEPLTDAPVRFVRFTAAGELIIGSIDGIEVVSIPSLSRDFHNRSELASQTVRAWSVGGGVFIEHALSTLHRLSPVTGRISEALPVPGDWEPQELVDILPYDHKALALFRERTVFYDDRGTVVGADVITGGKQYSQAVLSEDRVIVVSRHGRTRDRRTEADRRRSFVQRIFALSPNGRILQETDVRTMRSSLSAAGAVKGLLLLSNEQETAVVYTPLSTDAGSDGGQGDEGG